MRATTPTTVIPTSLIPTALVVALTFSACASDEAAQRDDATESQESEAAAETSAPAEPTGELLRVQVSAGDVYEVTTTTVRESFDGTVESIQIVSHVTYSDAADGGVIGRTKLVSASMKSGDGEFGPAPPPLVGMLKMMTEKEPAPDAPGLGERGGRGGQFHTAHLAAGEIPFAEEPVTVGHTYVIDAAGSESAEGLVVRPTSVSCNVTEVTDDDVALTCQADLVAGREEAPITQKVTVLARVSPDDGMAGQREIVTETYVDGVDEPDTERVKLKIEAVRSAAPAP